jgi:hypothetical protein
VALLSVTPRAPRPIHAESGVGVRRRGEPDDGRCSGDDGDAEVRPRSALLLVLL